MNLKTIIVVCLFLFLRGFVIAGEFRLEEVIVTAERKSASLQDTPISLSAFNEELLEKEGIDNLTDIASKVPSLTIQPFATNNATLRIFIRGVGLEDTQITQDSPVGVYIDGAYIARSTGLALDIADLERIEVLRGPQGTLYGRNSTGGAINLITRRPEIDAFSFKQHITVGNRALLSSKTMANIPMSDRLSVKLAYLKTKSDGFVENTGPGADFGDQDVSAYRVDIRWDVSDDFQFDYSYDRSEIVFVNYPYQPISPPNTTPRSTSSGDLIAAAVASNASSFVSFSEGRRESMATPVTMFESETEVEGHSVTGIWDISGSTQLKFISAWRELFNISYVDLSGGSQSPDYRIDNNDYTSRDGSLSLPRPENQGLRQEQQSHELQLQGSFASRIEYILGAYYFEEKAEMDGLPRHHQSTTPLSITETPTTRSTTYAVVTSGGAFTIDNEALAIFARLTWTPDILDDRFQITFGARHSEDKRAATKFVDNATLLEIETVDKSTGTASATPPLIIGSSVSESSASNRYRDDSFDFISEFEAGEGLNLYLKYAEAYKSGGYNTREPDQDFFQRGYEEEKIASYELGVKSEWLRGRLRVNGDVFRSDYTDIQLQFKLPSGISDSRIVNAGEARMSGAELEVDFLITPVLLTRLSYAYLDAEITKAIDPVSGVDTTDDFTFSSAPRNSYTASFDWTIVQWNFARMALNVSYNFMDDRDGSTRTDISKSIALQAYDLINARLGFYDIPFGSGTFTIAGWVKNLGDTEYAINGLAALPHASRAVIWGEPRTYGVDAILRF